MGKLLDAYIHSVAVTDVGFLVLLKNNDNEKIHKIGIGRRPI